MADKVVLPRAQVMSANSPATDPALAPVGHALALTGLLEQGNIRALDTELLRLREQADAQYGSVVRQFQCLRSILDGDTERAEWEAHELFAQAEPRDSAARAVFTTHIGLIRWMQGRIDEVEEALMLTRREHPEQVLWTASLAWLWFRQGRTTSADALFKSVPDVRDIPQDRYWLATVVVLAHVALEQGRHQDVVRLRELLLPFARRIVPVGIGVPFSGTCALTLGMLEEWLGLLDQARTHLEMAMELAGHIGAVAWHAEAQIELAEFALRHDVRDVPAYELLAEARATSAARGFAGLARRAMYRPRVRVLGSFDVTSLCGKRADWTSRKARELLKMLVAARGRATSREVFMDVLWPGEPPELLANRFSVALNVIRRSLDPDRLRPTHYHVLTEGDSVRLQVEHLDIDLEDFLALAQRSDSKSREEALSLYRGDAFAEDLYADWATAVRDHAWRVRLTLD